MKFLTCKLTVTAAISTSLFIVCDHEASAQKDTLIVTDSTRYEGEYPVGNGVLYSDGNGLFIGEFRNGIPEGSGVHYLPDGSIYSGHLSEGRHEGYGRFFSDSGKILAGEFRGDYANGLDTLWFPDGSVYIGTCRNGRPVSTASSEYGRLFSSTHAPSGLISAKPAFSGPELTGRQQKFLDETYRQYRKLTKNDRPPRFRGQDANEFSKWVSSQLMRHPRGKDSRETSIVVVNFCIDTDGSICRVEILESPDKDLSDKVSRIITSSPAWSPGISKGRKVRVTYTMPVIFR